MNQRRNSGHRSAEDVFDELLHLLALEDAENGDDEDTLEHRQWAQRLAEQARAQVAEQILRSEGRPPASMEALPAPPAGREDLVQVPDDELRLLALTLEAQQLRTN